MIRVLDGKTIDDEAKFHQQISLLLGMEENYGSNLDALWDRLSTDIERPVTLVWRDSEVSRKKLGEVFQQIVDVLERVKAQDREWNLQGRFEYRLE